MALLISLNGILNRSRKHGRNSAQVLYKDREGTCYRCSLRGLDGE